MKITELWKLVSNFRIFPSRNGYFSEIQLFDRPVGLRL